MRKKILIGLGVFAGLLAVFLVVVALQPDEFRVTRSATIAAPPGEVFPHVNDFRKWDAWSPWAKKDPNAKNTIEGGPGEGQIFNWAGNSEVGEGSMMMVISEPPEGIAIALSFIRPFEDTADVQFTFRPEGDQTIVTWTMSGKNNFISKAVCLFMDIDKMIGGDFENGLASLKAVVEGEKK